ncbi:MAG: PilZ domain-containing protein [Pseudomonadota bacterium]
MTTSNIDKRRFARLDMAIMIAYSVKNITGEISPEAEVLSSDISASGLRLMTPGRLDRGANLNLSIQLPNVVESISADGEVVWQTKLSKTSYETGVVIKNMNTSDKERFLNFIYDQLIRLVGSYR